MSSKRHSLSLSDTPRGSWASSDFDLRNSASDGLIPSLLERVPVEEIDRLNEARRMENRQEAIFSLYPLQDEVNRNSLTFTILSAIESLNIYKCAIPVSAGRCH